MQSMQTLVRRLLRARWPRCSLATRCRRRRGAGRSQEGKEYARLKNPLPVETGKKIEVIEFFSYGCPHCADLEPSCRRGSRRCRPTCSSAACR